MAVWDVCGHGDDLQGPPVINVRLYATLGDPRVKGSMYPNMLYTRQYTVSQKN